MLLGALCITGACRTRDPFFDLPAATQLETMSAYPLERQWQLYLYGYQRIHPPTLRLADPIAERGEQAVPYILGQLASSFNEIDFMSALWVFERMRHRGYFDICPSPYLATLEQYELQIKREATRKDYRRDLARLCRS